MIEVFQFQHTNFLCIWYYFILKKILMHSVTFEPLENPYIYIYSDADIHTEPMKCILYGICRIAVNVKKKKKRNLRNIFLVCWFLSVNSPRRETFQYNIEFLFKNILLNILRVAA